MVELAKSETIQNLKSAFRRRVAGKPKVYVFLKEGRWRKDTPSRYSISIGSGRRNSTRSERIRVHEKRW